MDLQFDQDVLHEDNCKIFVKTVDLAVKSINEHPPGIMLEMYNNIPVVRDMLSQFTKTTF
ncbi:hypothetical protein JB92DRAFT_3118406 [Gautieria morchelliformis]|nr:hypothetical protein JB92DRAFT_3118406 [Gautieria morchelliformis]